MSQEHKIIVTVKNNFDIKEKDVLSHFRREHNAGLNTNCGEQKAIEIINTEIVSKREKNPYEDFLMALLQVMEYSENELVIHGNINYDVRNKIEEIFNKAAECGEWVCTDPDEDQWRLKVGDDNWSAFMFKEKGECEIIFLDDFSTAEIKSTLDSYGYEYDRTHFSAKDCQGNNIPKSVIAECLFEMEIQ